ncbi:MAG: hypothetical protein J2P21_15485 [Chloracidobacterium sp.]|nr:hypothetical protein [Chloracidobacterium sp.]
MNKAIVTVTAIDRERLIDYTFNIHFEDYRHTLSASNWPFGFTTLILRTVIELYWGFGDSQTIRTGPDDWQYPGTVSCAAQLNFSTGFIDKPDQCFMILRARRLNAVVYIGRGKLVTKLFVRSLENSIINNLHGPEYLDLFGSR